MMINQNHSQISRNFRFDLRVAIRVGRNIQFNWRSRTSNKYTVSNHALGKARLRNHFLHFYDQHGKKLDIFFHFCPLSNFLN